MKLGTFYKGMKRRAAIIIVIPATTGKQPLNDSTHDVMIAAFM